MSVMVCIGAITIEARNMSCAATAYNVSQPSDVIPAIVADGQIVARFR